MRTITRIPVAITVSRETGQVISAERAEVEEKDFRDICRELIKIHKEKKGAREG